MEWSSRCDECQARAHNTYRIWYGPSRKRYARHVEVHVPEPDLTLIVDSCLSADSTVLWPAHLSL